MTNREQESRTSEREADHVRFDVGSDVGGTFTDLWVRANDGRTKVVKTPTTGDIVSGVVTAVDLAAGQFGMSAGDFCARISRFGHGTTVGLNALLTGRYATTGIVTTRGFGDTLEIGRLRRQAADMKPTEVTDYSLRGRQLPLVSRANIVEVDERVDVGGEVVRPLDEDDARAALAILAGREVEAVAVCTLWSTANPVHENRLRQLTQEVLPTAAISVSHETSHVVGEYARMTTTAANAALIGVAGDYAAQIQERLRELGCTVPVLLMTGAGGVVPTEYVRDRPVTTLVSGPSAAVVASERDVRRLDRKNVLSIDIGGTSFDVGVVVQGRPLVTTTLRLAGAELRVPTIDVRSIGAGGGSIASVREGELRVGPESAGADPGPACYGRGGTSPTATDADLVLGVLDPDRFVGGTMRLDVEAAYAAIRDHVAAPLGLGIVQAAWGIREVITSRMADLLRQVTIERGQDPREFVLLAAGGSGPSHAAALARELGILEVVVPSTATAQSAYGTATSEALMTAERTLMLRIRPATSMTSGQLEMLEQAIESATAEVRSAFARHLPEREATTEVAYALRYGGQSHHIEIAADSLPVALEEFEQEYERLFGRGAAFPEAGFELVSVRATATAGFTGDEGAPPGEELQRIGARIVIFSDPDAPVETPVYSVEFPADGQVLEGPALVEFPGHTVVIPPDWRARTDRFGNLLLAPKQ